MKHKPILLAVSCLATAYALAATSGPCVTTYPECDMGALGAPCGGTATITFGTEQAATYVYCGGNASDRCADDDPAKCSEMFIRSGRVREVQCGGQVLGYCFVQIGSGVTRTGRDCGGQECQDVAPSDRVPLPTIIGSPAPCNEGVTPCKNLPAPVIVD